MSLLAGIGALSNLLKISAPIPPAFCAQPTGIASGKSVRQIADELSLSEATVYTYRERILGKMKMNSVAELTRYALEHELID
jgi:xanthosine utilization system XapX-like protein